MALKTEFDHIAIAVKDIDSFSSIFNKLGIIFGKTEKNEFHKVKTAFSSGKNAIELIQATEEKSPLFPILEHPVTNFIKKHGEGLHHIALKVDDITKAIKEFEAEGIETLDNGIFEAHGKRKAVFLKPSEKLRNILIEIIEE